MYQIITCLATTLVSVARFHVIVLLSLICSLKIGIRRQVPHPIPDNSRSTPGSLLSNSDHCFRDWVPFSAETLCAVPEKRK